MEFCANQHLQHKLLTTALQLSTALLECT